MCLKATRKKLWSARARSLKRQQQQQQQNAVAAATG